MKQGKIKIGPDVPRRLFLILELRKYFRCCCHFYEYVYCSQGSFLLESTDII